MDPDNLKITHNSDSKKFFQHRSLHIVERSAAISRERKREKTRQRAEVHREFCNSENRNRERGQRTRNLDYNLERPGADRGAIKNAERETGPARPDDTLPKRRRVRACVRACARLYNTDAHKTFHGDVLKSRPTRKSALSSRGGEPPPSTRRSRERRTNCRSPGPYNFIKVEQKTLGHDLPLRDREWIDELHTGG